MEIVDLKTYVVGNPIPYYGGFYWIFLKLTTDEGVEGFGEVYSIPFNPGTVEKMIEDVVERYVIGSDPFRVERLWRTIYSSGYSQHPDLTMMGDNSFMNIMSSPVSIQKAQTLVAGGTYTGDGKAAE